MKMERICAIYLTIGLIVFAVSRLMPSGMYGGFFHGNFTLTGDDIIHVYLKAEKPNQWHWRRPSNHHYEQINLEINFKDRNALINLSSGDWKSGDEKGRLDLRGLAKLVTLDTNPHNLNSIPDDQLQFMLDQFLSLRDGSAFRPRHHSHNVESPPIRAHFQHFTLGGNYVFFVPILWIVMWPIILIVIAKKLQYSLSLLFKRYCLTLAIMVALDAALIGIGMLNSPGPISEFVEFFVPLINLPGWILVGSWAPFPALFFVGGMCWATLVSMFTLVRLESNSVTKDDSSELLA